MKRRRSKKFGAPAGWGWMLGLGIVGAALYSADVFGLRTKVIDPVLVNLTPKQGA